MSPNCMGDISRQLVTSPHATSSALVEQALSAAAPIVSHFPGGRVLVTAEIPDEWEMAISSDIEVVLRGEAAAFARLAEKHRNGKLRYVMKYTASQVAADGSFEPDDEPDDFEVLGMVDRYAAVRITRNERLDCLSVELC